MLWVLCEGKPNCCCVMRWSVCGFVQAGYVTCHEADTSGLECILMEFCVTIGNGWEGLLLWVECEAWRNGDWVCGEPETGVVLSSFGSGESSNTDELLDASAVARGGNDDSDMERDWDSSTRLRSTGSKHVKLRVGTRQIERGSYCLGSAILFWELG